MPACSSLGICQGVELLEPMITLCLTFSGIVKLVSFSPHFYLHIYRIHCAPKSAIVCGITFNAWSLICCLGT